MMDHFKYSVLPPAMHGEKRRAFLFEIVHFRDGTCGYQGMSIQRTVWMKKL